MNNWFNLAKPSDTGKATINIFDQIGKGVFDDSGIAANDFVNALNDLGAIEQIDLHICSVGGSVTDGLAIYHTLKNHKAKIVVHIDGIAASIASVIMMAGDEIRIPPSGLIMVHDPATLLMAGNAESLRREADTLDLVAANMTRIYAARTGQTEDKIRELMQAETWLSGEEAVALGFADTLAEESKIAAHASTEAAQRRVHAELVASAQLQAKDRQIVALQTELEQLRKSPAAPAAVISACAQAGVGTAIASRWIDQGLPMEAVTNHLAFASAVADRCAAAGVRPDPYLAHADNPAQCFGLALAERLAREADDSYIDSSLTATTDDHSHGWDAAMDKVNKKRGF